MGKLTQTKPNLNVHFNAPSVRHDTWGRLRRAALSLSAEKNGTQSLKKEIADTLETLKPMEVYMGYPGNEEFKRISGLWQERDYTGFALAVSETTELLETGDYRREIIKRALGYEAPHAHCFDLLVVKRFGPEQESKIREDLLQWRSENDGFIYNLVVVDSFEDALMAIMLNFDIQACVIHGDIARESQQSLHALEGLKQSLTTKVESSSEMPLAVVLGSFINQLRPEINLFLTSEVSPEKLAGDVQVWFDRIFYSHESSSELHLSIVKAVANRYETPFFDAVKKYSREPVGTFHALPIARGNSVFDSPWLKDFFDFYGSDIFLAESSATTGGLDSILQPTGTLKAAQERAAEAYGAKTTVFATNGTSMSNKVVHQALTCPGDIVLLDRACHESHHLSFILTGASTYYLDSYALDEYSISGGVQLVTVKRALIDLAEKGLLEKVKMIILTNCTFDGLTYNVQAYMEEILAIKPDIIFLWDEAWFAFARFVPHYRQRTAMHSARVLSDKFSSVEYRRDYKAYKAKFLSKNKKPGDAWVKQKLMPDPAKVKIRVYATQSTHKTLSCFRQGSMIHIWDECFTEHVSDQFKKSYLTHSTTSPNYQILASMDASRRQVHMEGYELVQRQIEMALLIRKTINDHPLLSQYFCALGPTELIPEEYRVSGVKSGFKGAQDWEVVARAWDMDDFVLDPCRINVYTGKTGISGFEIRTKYLADKHNIQVNKTGMNTFCLMTNVGTTRSSVAYLINCLVQIAEECQKRDKGHSKAQRKKFEEQRRKVTKLPALPEIQKFHPKYLHDSKIIAGKMREAYFDGYDCDATEYISIDEIGTRIAAGREVVGATFIVPVPPGYPMIAPGQIINQQSIIFLKALNASEIIGLDPDLGVRVFRESHFGKSKIGTKKKVARKRAKRSQKRAKPSGKR